MKSKSLLIKVLLITTAILLLPFMRVHAGSTNWTSLFGARALSLNGLYFAGVDGLHGTFTNPSSLSYLEGTRGIELTIGSRIGQGDFTSPLEGIFKSNNDALFNLGGGLYYNFPSVGLSLGAGYNRAIDYDVNWPFGIFKVNKTVNSVLTFDLNNSIQIDAITPTLSYRMGMLSFGLTADIYRVSESMAFFQGNDQWYRGLGQAAYQFRYSTDAWAYGITLGVMADVNENLRLGAFYKSSFKAKLKGEATSSMFNELDSLTATRSNISTTWQMPNVLGFGGVYSFSKDLSVNVDIALNFWKSTQKVMNFSFSDPMWQSSLQSTDTTSGINAGSFPLYFNNSVDFGLGVEFKAIESLTLRFGYRYSQTPNSDQSYSLLFPSVNQNWLSVGFNIEGEGYIIDAALAYSFGISKEISRGASGKYVSGKYNAENFLPAVSIHYAL